MKLSDKAREIRNARARAYYATHKRQQAEYNRRYWEKQAALAEAETAQNNAATPDGTTPTPGGERANGAN